MSYWQKALGDPQAKFTGRNVLVTGANSGLGLEAAVKFAKLDAAQVVLGVRDIIKGQQAQQIIHERTGRSEGIHVLPLDMNSYDSIQAFVTRLSSTLDRLDVALLNAGVFSTEFRPSPQGWEETVQVNVLSTALLALLLLPHLKRSHGISTLEFVSSRRQEAFQISPERSQAANLLETFNDPASFVPRDAYQGSKLLITAFANHLASLVSPESHAISILAVCPGFCSSNLSRGYTGFAATALRFVLDTFVLRSADEGARTLVSGASLGAQGHGKFWFDDEMHPMYVRA